MNNTIYSAIERLSARLQAFRRSERAQTLNDFAVGTTIFLFTVLFVYAFIPQLLAPFGLSDHSGNPIRADRTANFITEDTLSEDGSTNTLDSACTEAFFSNTTVSDCPSYSPSSLSELTGNTDTTRFNVTISKPDGSIVTHNGVELKRGPTPPQSDNVVVSTRIVSLESNTYYLRVKLW